MGEVREIEGGHGDRCTWHEVDVRCNAPAVLGSVKKAVCMDHLKVIRKLEMEPAAYAAWLASVES